MKTGGRATVSVARNRFVRNNSSYRCMTFEQWRKVEAVLETPELPPIEVFIAERGFQKIDARIKDFLRRREYG